MRPRIVCSLTTLPDRYDALLTTLRSIHKQNFDKIYLTLPLIAKRFNQPYPEVSEEIKDLCTIVRCDQDYGPICKIYGALVNEHDPNTLIMTMDDDNLFTKDFVRVFLEKHALQPKAVITGCGALVGSGLNFFSINTSIHELKKYKGLLGFNCPPTGRQVDILQGFSGVLYTRYMLPDKDHLNDLLKYGQDHDLFCNDDIVLSAYLNSKNIKIMTFNNMPSVKSIYLEENALSYDCLNMFSRLKRAFYKMQKLGMFKHIAYTTFGESPIFKIPLIIFMIILLMIMIGLYCWYF